MQTSQASGALSANIVDLESRRIFAGRVEWHDGVITRLLQEGPENPGLSYLLPGFIDAHVHIESSMLVPAEFARLAARDRQRAWHRGGALHAGQRPPGALQAVLRRALLRAGHALRDCRRGDRPGRAGHPAAARGSFLPVGNDEFSRRAGARCGRHGQAHPGALPRPAGGRPRPRPDRRERPAWPRRATRSPPAWPSSSAKARRRAISTPCTRSSPATRSGSCSAATTSTRTTSRAATSTAWWRGRWRRATTAWTCCAAPA